MFALNIPKAKCLLRYIKLFFKLRIFCKCTFYKVNLKHYGIAFCVQYIVNINKKGSPVKLQSHYITDDPLRRSTFSLELGLYKDLFLRNQHEKSININ